MTCGNYGNLCAMNSHSHVKFSLKVKYGKTKCEPRLWGLSKPRLPVWRGCTLPRMNAWNQETPPVSDSGLSFLTFECIDSDDDVKKRRGPTGGWLVQFIVQRAPDYLLSLCHLHRCPPVCMLHNEVDEYRSALPHLWQTAPLWCGAQTDRQTDRHT